MRYPFIRALILTNDGLVDKAAELIEGLEVFVDAIPNTWTVDGITREVGFFRHGKWVVGEVVMVYDNRVHDHIERARQHS